jgi:hypothetical protein
MAKQYHIQLRGKQREQIDADLVAQLVVMLGSQLAEDARQAITAEREAQETDTEANQTPDSKPGEPGRRTT